MEKDGTGGSHWLCHWGHRGHGEPVYLLCWVFNKVVAPGWLLLQMRQIIGLYGNCQIRRPHSRAECNVDDVTYSHKA